MCGSPRSSTLRKAMLAAGVCVGASALVPSAQAMTIVSDGFSGSNGTTIDGRTPDGADLPGATWSVLPFNSGGGFGATIATGSGNPAPAAYLNDAGNSTGGIAISIASAGAYTQPSQFQISADILCDTNNWVYAGLGFYSALPSAATTGNTIYTNFTGLEVRWATGALQLYVNGTAVGSTVAYTGTYDDTAYHTLSYIVDSDGTISDVSFSGSTSTYSFTTNGFTSAATAYAAADTTYTWARDHWTQFDNFTIATVPEPMSAGLLGLSGSLLLARRKAKTMAGVSGRSGGPAPAGR